MKFRTIKAREGKGLALSIMQLLDDAPDDDEDSFEAESEDDDDDDDQWGDTQGHSVNENSDAELSSDDEGSQSDDGESPKGRFTPSNGHQIIQRLQDDLLADEDEPDDGTLYFYRISICLCLAIRFIRTWEAPLRPSTTNCSLGGRKYCQKRLDSDGRGELSNASSKFSFRERSRV